MLAHIGNIPVEEWLPFVAPVVVLYVYGRRRERRRRSAVAELPAAPELLDDGVVARVLDRLREGGHPAIRAAHLPLLYPPGPDGLTVEQLAERGRSDPGTVDALLDELEQSGYVELEGADGTQTRATLTIEGYDLVNATEAALLDAAREKTAPAG